MTLFWGPHYPDAASGGGGGSVTPPVIAFVTPTPNIPPGSAGAMSLSYATARKTPIVLTVTDVDGAAVIKYLAIMAVFLDGSVESIYHHGAFVGEYLDGSTQTDVTNGAQLSIVRADGWPGARSGGNLAVGIIVDAITSDGVVTSGTAYYQMPFPTGEADLLPANPQSTAIGAADIAAEIRSRIIWQFRSS